MVKIKVADYVAQFLSNKGVQHIFTVTGGGAMFLNDGIAREKDITPIFCHHEQSCTMAAVAYTKIHNRVGVVMPTTGCGGTNTITGLLDAWQDSNKILIISGQVNKKETTHFTPIGLRKYGVQEADIVSIVKPITKWAVVVDDAKRIKYYLEKAYDLCNSGRPGPVWLDIPLDIQGTYINVDELEPYIPEIKLSGSDVRIEQFLSEAERPVIVAGYGIHLANARNEFKIFVEKYKIPVTFTYLTIDILPSDHPQYVGRLGTKGDRAGNFAIQNSDLVLSIGSSLSIPVTGFRYDTFAREAKVVVVDIDPVEHKKPTIRVDHFIQSDAKVFLEANLNINYQCPSKWLTNCIKWRNNWSVHNKKDKNLNLYTFTKELSDAIANKENTVVISDAGSAYYVTCQALLIKNGRFITSGAQAEMGFTLPACIGASFANPQANIVGVTGDGSFQFNIQELQTIIHYNLPIKLFVLNNNGYLSIRNTQDKFFEGRHFGTSPISGVSFPSLEKIAKAYNFEYIKIKSLSKLKKSIRKILDSTKPIVCEIILPDKEQILPSSSAKQNEEGKIISQPLENMFPFLSDEEFRREMIIKPI
jgi:acetolactate synthase-1/2/3 large subunit